MWLNVKKFGKSEHLNKIQCQYLNLHWAEQNLLYTVSVEKTRRIHGTRTIWKKAKWNKNAWCEDIWTRLLYPILVSLSSWTYSQFVFSSQSVPINLPIRLCRSFSTPKVAFLSILYFYPTKCLGLLFAYLFILRSWE